MSTRPRTVLVVEAEPRSAEVIAAALELAAFRVVRASDSAEARERLRAEPVPPRAVILDWSLPGGTARELLSGLASDPRYGTNPIIVLCPPEWAGRMPTLCVSAVLIRPIDPQRLVRVVERAIARNDDIVHRSHSPSESGRLRASSQGD
jgi:DNA-binding response OmpR family regulator